MKFSSQYLNHLSFWFVTVFATPLFIALNNAEDVTFAWPKLALVLLACSLGLGLLSTFAARLAGANIAQRLGLLMLGLALVLAVQANVVHDLFFYGNFNGEQINFRRHGQAFWYEWYGFLSALVLVILALQWWRPKNAWLAWLPILSSTLLVLPALMGQAGQAVISSEEEVIDPAVFGWSRNGNLVHLLADGFQSDVVEQVLQENPDLAERFTGFTFFSNHLGMYQGTAPAVPTILTGRPFELGLGHDYQRVMADIQAHGYPGVLKDNGYRLDYALISKAYCDERADSCIGRAFNDMKTRGYFRHRSDSSRRAVRILADLSLFRMIPMMLKEQLYDDGHWTFSDTTLDGSSPWPDPVTREWTEYMTVTDGPPAFKYYHFIGTHIPPHWDAGCQYHRELERNRENYMAQAYCVLQGMAGLIDELKAQGIYDQTAFVVTGDHGHNIAPIDELHSSQQSSLPPRLMGSARPVFMIRERGNDAPLVFNRAPTSLVDVAPTALDLAGLDPGEDLISALDLEENSERERYFTPYSIRDLFSGRPVPHVVYRVGPDVRDSRGWLLDEIVPYRVAPSEYDPVNYRHGQDLVHGARFSVNEPDKEATWINGRQMAFLISRPAKETGPFELKFAFHLPRWMPPQSFDLSINGESVGESVPVVMGKGYWQQVSVDLEGVSLKAENNFVSLRFAASHPPPGIEHWEAAGLIRSIRLVRKPASDTSTAVASRP